MHHETLSASAPEAILATMTSERKNERKNGPPQVLVQHNPMAMHRLTKYFHLSSRYPRSLVLKLYNWIEFFCSILVHCIDYKAGISTLESLAIERRWNGNVWRQDKDFSVLRVEDVFFFRLFLEACLYEFQLNGKYGTNCSYLLSLAFTWK